MAASLTQPADVVKTHMQLYPKKHSTTITTVQYIVKVCRNSKIWLYNVQVKLTFNLSTKCFSVFLVSVDVHCIHMTSIYWGASNQFSIGRDVLVVKDYLLVLGMPIPCRKETHYAGQTTYNHENIQCVHGVLCVDFNFFKRFIYIYGIIQQKLKET